MVSLSLSLQIVIQL